MSLTNNLDHTKQESEITLTNESIDKNDKERTDLSTVSQLTDTSTEFKKRKPSSLNSTSSYTTNIVDFSSYSDQILPQLEDEDVKEIGSFTWVVPDLSKLKDDKVHSPSFTVGDYDFSILFFPKGNANSNIALYLEPLPKKHKIEEAGELKEIYDDPKWYVCAQFTLIISNPKDPKNAIINTSHQRFSKFATDWGFSNFTELKALTHSRRDFGPLSENDALYITAFVKVLNDPTGVLWHNFLDYDSKKETGFVGIKNQGATCYLNSLLQSYYFTNSFRNAVYQIPTEQDIPESSVSLALQRIFYQLQHSDEALDTGELTKAFGWTSSDAFDQHDVQELNRILMDRLESNMKGTEVENDLNKTFVGKMKTYCKCINVDYESSRIEDFWDVQLNVKNLENLHQSFQDYINVEILDGENKYNAQDYGLQDAKKGVVFEQFPSVLHLQLKRFEYDFDYNRLIKVNDRHEFPESIDLSPFLDQESAAKNGTKIDPLIYDLHGVLVHAGEISMGHYYALLRPTDSDNWYRFDDDKVWKVTHKQVFEENFGMSDLPQIKLNKMTRLQYQNYLLRKQTSAYMLVYIKRDDKAKILQEVTDKDVPLYLSRQLDQELESRAKERKDAAEQHLYKIINLYSKALFEDYEGFDLGPDFRQGSKSNQSARPTSIKVLKTQLFKDVYPQILEALNLEKDSNLKIWTMSYRRNQTSRPSSLLKGVNELSVEDIYKKYFSKKYSDVNLFIEDPKLELNAVKYNSDLSGFENVEKPTEAERLLNEQLIESSRIIVFVKYFDIQHQKLRLVSHIIVDEDDILKDFLPTISNFLGFSDETKLNIYEEINPGSIESINPSKTFQKLELTNGDIITVEEVLENPNSNDIYPFYPSAVEYYDYLQNKVFVTVKPFSGVTEEDEFVLINQEIAEKDHDKTLINDEDGKLVFPISQKCSHDDLAKIVGRRINKDPRFLRFFISYNKSRFPFKPDMTVYTVTSRNVEPNFEYEVLTIPLKDLESMQTLKVRWLPHSYVHYQEHEIIINRQSIVDDLINKIALKLNLSDEQRSQVFMWANFQSKFNRVLYPTDDIEPLTPDFEVYASIEKDLLEPLKYNMEGDEDEDDSIDEVLGVKPVAVVQFHKDPKRRLHGISFVFEFKKDETLTETIKRLQERFGLGVKEFGKIKICLWNAQDAPVYFKNPFFTGQDEVNEGSDPNNFIPFTDSGSQFFLGLDHPDRAIRASNQTTQGGISIR
ncbi:hypothetical protein WICMUC_003103 [Wickerhamomyces mucosus]|uniref:ubiquitinyl hydrolase 1 n=1 Tax=Wickerhamomyces mucosus TaxID=1378264 RepID=A0A9P8PMC1_9ASCO|nr:hypothetical protein WICMUC_003103 [Wickerhamomyces mucosus]